MHLGGEALGVLPAGWFPTTVFVPPIVKVAASILFLVTAGANRLEFSGVKNTGVVEDLVFSYGQSVGAGSLRPATLTVPQVSDGPYSFTVYIPRSIGYACRVYGVTSGATAWGIGTVA